MEIITDYKWKSFRYRNEVPKRILAREFDYLDSETALDGFFRYRRRWYHVDDFTNAPTNLAPWNGIAYDSYFSGVVIEISDDGESYRVGTAIS